jgi:hypothetical protein
MAGFTQYVLLLLCMAFALGLTFPLSNGGNVISKSSTLLSSSKIDNSQIPTNVPIIGGFSFPNPFALFSNFVLLMSSFVTMPYDVISGLELPLPLFSFLIVIFVLLIVVRAASWWKGNDTS